MEIHNHFRERGTWVNWERTTDTFKAGDPEKPVRTIAVAWKPSWDALKEAGIAIPYPQQDIYIRELPEADDRWISSSPDAMALAKNT